MTLFLPLLLMSLQRLSCSSESSCLLSRSLNSSMGRLTMSCWARGGQRGAAAAEDRDLHVEADAGLPGDLLVLTQPHRLVIEGATQNMSRQSMPYFPSPFVIYKYGQLNIVGHFTPRQAHTSFKRGGLHFFTFILQMCNCVNFADFGQPFDIYKRKLTK